MQVTRRPTGQSYRAIPPFTLGHTEELAGITDRSAFWLQFSDLHHGPAQDYIDAGMQAADRLIQQRVRKGELTLLYNPAPARAARDARLRAAAQGRA